MNAPLLSIIIVSYNTAEHTVSALRSIYEKTQTHFEIIVVDNCSTDDSVAQINRQFSQIRLIQSTHNGGFAAGVQQGVAQAQGKYLLLLNPDTLILDRAIDQLLNFAMNNPQHGIWGGVTLNNDLSINTQHAWAKPNFMDLFFSAFGLSKTFSSSCFFNHTNYGCWQRDTVKEVDIISGCFFLTTRTVWDALGGLDPTFFMYAEEADYCLRAKQLGYQPIVNPNARIIHHGGLSHSQFSGKQIKLLTGKVELIHRHISVWKQPFYKFLLYIYVLNKYISTQVLKRGTAQSREWKLVFDKRQQWLKGYP